MYKFLLRPKWIATHILVITLMVTMVNLAMWQLDRHQQRKDFNATLVQRFDAPIRPLDELLQSGDPADIEWMPTALTGTYIQGEDVSLVNVSQNGAAGYDAITPLLLGNGKVVLVNRGFLPLVAEFPSAPSGEVSILGRIRATSERRTGAVSDPATGELAEVQRIDIARLQQQIDGELVPVYVQLLKSTPAEAPSLSTIVDPEFGNGPHMSYVIQWILFALCAAGGWVALVRRDLLKARKPGL
jgi:cytochrome oxidase assembly protein ShyY1